MELEDRKRLTINYCAQTFQNGDNTHHTHTHTRARACVCSFVCPLYSLYMYVCYVFSAWTDSFGEHRSHRYNAAVFHNFNSLIATFPTHTLLLTRSNVLCACRKSTYNIRISIFYRCRAIFRHSCKLFNYFTCKWLEMSERGCV